MSSITGPPPSTKLPPLLPHLQSPPAQHSPPTPTIQIRSPTFPSELQPDHPPQSLDNPPLLSPHHQHPFTDIPSASKLSTTTSDTAQQQQSFATPPLPLPPPLRPPFSPFFTLITDSTNPSHPTIHHPRNIHYIFSDDDPAILTSAYLAALDSEDLDSSTTFSPDSAAAQAAAVPRKSHTSTSSASTTATNATGERKRTGGEEERILLLDIDPLGTSLTKAVSLTSKFQILNTKLEIAPTWAGGAETDTTLPGNGEGQPGYMLRIEGTGIIGNGGIGVGGGGVGKTGTATGASGVVGEGKMEALMREFDARMEVLRTVVVRGGGDFEIGGGGGGEGGSRHGEEEEEDRGDDHHREVEERGGGGGGGGGGNGETNEEELNDGVEGEG